MCLLQVATERDVEVMCSREHCSSETMLRQASHGEYVQVTY